MDQDSTLESRVAKYGEKYGNCAQASFHALHEHYRLDGDVEVLVRAMRFLPGTGATFETCGAVSGCLAALGLRLGGGPGEDWLTQAKRARRFCAAVREELGSTRCGEIMERLNGRRFDHLDPAQMREYVESGAGRKCGEAVQGIVRLASPYFEGRADPEQ